ncbi:hypothetical protein ACWCYY_38600 [Kitasatospora sp. NPDC001664]
MFERVLGLEPLVAVELPVVRLPHGQKERRNLAAAAQYREREAGMADGTKVEVGLECSSPTAAYGGARSRPSGPPG